MIEADRLYLQQLRLETLKVLRREIGERVPVALVDATVSRNVGDSLLYLGEISYIRQLGLDLRYCVDLASYSSARLRKVMPEGVVLLQAGGNLGDLWAHHQQLRERVITELPDYRIVQLPQSIWFSDARRAMDADRIMRAHPDLTILLREHASMQRAARDIPNVKTVFCPDVALGWDASAISDAKDGRVVVLARRDHESGTALGGIPGDWLPSGRTTVVDWHNTGMGSAKWWFSQVVIQLLRINTRWQAHWRGIPEPASLLHWAERHICSINANGVEGGVRLFSGAKGIVTDRLHAHILASLLGIPHVVLDNSYGKVGAVFEAYTHGFSTAHRVSSIEEARDIAATF